MPAFRKGHKQGLRVLKLGPGGLIFELNIYVLLTFKCVDNEGTSFVNVPHGITDKIDENLGQDIRI